MLKLKLLSLSLYYRDTNSNLRHFIFTFLSTILQSFVLQRKYFLFFCRVFVSIITVL
jgi:hypothetical protein